MSPWGAVGNPVKSSLKITGIQMLGETGMGRRMGNEERWNLLWDQKVSSLPYVYASPDLGKLCSLPDHCLCEKAVHFHWNPSGNADDASWIFCWAADLLSLGVLAHVFELPSLSKNPLASSLWTNCALISRNRTHFDGMRETPSSGWTEVE